MIFWITFYILHIGFSVHMKYRNMRQQIFMKSSGEINVEGSQRLKLARLRLAEARGIIPIGSSELGINLNEFKTLPVSQSKVREISWRVAEPATPYDPDRAATKLWRQPVRWLVRNVQIFVPLLTFVTTVIGDVVSNKEESNRKQRAQELLNIISAQSPALIKAGQALASRPDLLPKEYLDELQKLQDRCPAYPTEEAIALLEEELGGSFSDFFEWDDVTKTDPIAAASIGQVYKAKLRSNGQSVAIKIQRPNCEEAIAIDLYVMRWYSQFLQKILNLLSRDINLVSIIDDFGELIYREIDYRAEAVNAQRFAELYASIPDVFVPKVYTDLSTSKVLTMEWVDGARLSDRSAILAMGFEPGKFVDTLVQCSLRQMLENGFFHADPHGGNLLAMQSGKLCYLDFGMVSYVEASQRLSIIEAVIHLVNRDFNALAELYRRMGFIPNDVNTKPIVIALEAALPDVLNAAVGELNFKNVISKLGDVMYKFPFSLPPFYIAIIRCLGVLEGVAIQVDSKFRIIEDAYPYIASRLLTDSSTELQNALQQLLFKDGQPRWERLKDLLQVATQTSDYDSSLAAEQLLSYLISDRAKDIRTQLQTQLVVALDELGDDAVTYLLTLLSPSTLSLLPTRDLLDILFIRDGTKSNRTSDILKDLITTLSQVAKPSDTFLSTSEVILLVLDSSKGMDAEKFNTLVRKTMKESVAQEFLASLVSDLSEKAATRAVRRVFGIKTSTPPNIIRV